MTKPTQTIRLPIPDAEELDLITPGENSFDLLVDRRQAASKAIEKLKVEVAECDIQIGAILDLNQVKRVSWRGEKVVTRREPSAPRRSISAEKLLGLGVPPSIIKQATVFGNPGKPSISIRSIRREDDSDDEEGPDGNW